MGSGFVRSRRPAHLVQTEAAEGSLLGEKVAQGGGAADVRGVGRVAFDEAGDTPEHTSQRGAVSIGHEYEVLFGELTSKRHTGAVWELG